MRLDGVRIETPDLAAACARYATLLGVDGVPLETGATRFQLARGAIELVAGEPGRATVVFVRERPNDDWPDDPRGYHGLPVAVEAPSAVSPAVAGGDAAEAIDHVVVFTPNPSRAIALWRDRLGLRLAFDREFPERKVRLLFFRSGGLTFEVASALPAADGDD